MFKLENFSKMTLEKTFYFFYLLSIAVGYLRYYTAKPEHLKLLKFDGVDYVIPLYWFIYWFIVLLMTLAIYLISIRHKNGFNIFVIMTSVEVLIEFTSGFRVYSPLQNGICAITVMLWGSVLYKHYYIKVSGIQSEQSKGLV